MTRSFSIISQSVRDNCIDAILELPLDKYQVVIRERVKSLEAEAYFHAILDYIAEQTGHSAEELKVRIKIPILGYDEIEHKGEKYRIVKTSRNATKSQYNEMIDAALIMANWLNVNLPPKSYYGFE